MPTNIERDHSLLDEKEKKVCLNICCRVLLVGLSFSGKTYLILGTLKKVGGRDKFILS